MNAGENAWLEIPAPKKIELIPEKIPLDIVYDDKDIIVVNKPSGMVVHPAAGNWSGTLVNALLGIDGIRLSGIRGELRPGIVHRIDKDTSGLLVVAKSDSAAISLGKQFAAHSIHREYFAICLGSFKQSEGKLETQIGRLGGDRQKFSVLPSSDKDKGKWAVTHYETLSEREIAGKIYTLVRLWLETGRTHQIRVHMAHIGHPLAGDPVYGKKKNPFGISGQALHAKTLGFFHPRANEYVEFDSELPEEFAAMLP
jgi:23S rRNA pseudouridine1911/1915/1917 synthase